jgi:hypothetical protein
MKRAPLYAAFAVCAAGLCAAALMLARPPKPARTSSQSDYPVLSAGLLDAIPTSLKEQVKASKLIADATVQKVLDENRVYTPQKGAAEKKLYKKLDSASSVYPVRIIKLRVGEAFKGRAAQSMITMTLTPAELDAAPSFKPGDRLVFMLSRYVDGSYTPATPQDGFYYVAADDRIYPAVLSGLLKSQSGRLLGDFKREIQTLAKS